MSPLRAVRPVPGIRKAQQTAPQKMAVRLLRQETETGAETQAGIWRKRQSAETNAGIKSIIHDTKLIHYTQDKFSCARKLNEAMPVASSIEADAADGNLDK